MSNEREIQEKVIQMRYLEGQANAIQQQMLLAEEALISIDTAISSLKQLANSKDKETLAPLGAGVFAYSMIKDDSKVLIDTGSGVILEKKPEEALKSLEERRENAVQNIKTLSSLMEDLRQKYSEAGTKVEELRK